MLGAAGAARAQAPVKQWDRVFGGTAAEVFADAHQTADGGYILGGWSGSPVSGDKTQVVQGDDYWIVKLDAAGNKQWDRTIGGLNHDALQSIQQTTDGGYILGGWSVSEVGGDKTQPNHSPNSTDQDYWIVKLDAAGNKQWDRTFGGQNDETLLRVRQTADGGYLLGGVSESGVSGDKTQPNRGFGDYWVVKLNASGNKQWDRTFGGSGDEHRLSFDARQMADGGYLIGGTSYSPLSGDKTQNSRGDADYWLVRLDAAGNKQWDKVLGSSAEDMLSALLPTPDGGCLVGGYSNGPVVSGDKTQASYGLTDYWVVKLDASGAKQWDRTYGGTGNDQLYALQSTTDGGYLLAGNSDSGLGNDKSQPSQGLADYWVLKINATGAKQWDATFGGPSTEQLRQAAPTTDGNFLLSGFSYGGAGGDKSAPGWGGPDYWVVKLTNRSTTSVGGAGRGPALGVYPNPARQTFVVQLPVAPRPTRLELRLLDGLGRVVRQQPVPAQQTTATVSVQGLPAGIYMVQLTGGAMCELGQVVVP